MKKEDISIEGYGYRLRTVTPTDAEFIIKVRNQDGNKYLPKISSDIDSQKKWIEKQLQDNTDYYFVIENLKTSQSEGLISVYDIKNSEAEWGRWCTQNGSRAGVASAILLFKFVFEHLKLEALYGVTILENKSVVSFHDRIEERVEVLREAFEIDGKSYDAVKHKLDKQTYIGAVNILAEKALIIEKRLKSN